jgi:Predicted membrane protein (DUF2142)
MDKLMDFSCHCPRLRRLLSAGCPFGSPKVIPRRQLRPGPLGPIRSRSMTGPLRRRMAWLFLAVSGLSLVVAWMLASPVGASPDEQAHIDYAWGTVTGQTVIGERLVTIPGGRTATSVQVPQRLLQFPAPGCYAFHPERPVTECAAIPADNLKLVTQASYMSRYPPLFYVAEGAVLRGTTAVDLSGPGVLYGARLVAALMSLLAVGAGVFLLSRRFPDRVVVLATLLALPATAWFLAASVNPNGLEIAAAFLLAAGVLAVRVDHAAGARSATAILAVPIGTLLLAWTRPVSWVWAALILAVLLVPTGQKDGVSWRRRLPVRRLGALAISATVLVLAGSMVWFVYALGIRNSEAARVNAGGWAGLNPVGRVLLLLLHSGTIVSEQVGTFGWLDTPLPPLAILAWVSIAGVAVAIWAVGRNASLPQWTLGAVLGLGYLAALLDEYKGAWGWQGRYLLPVTAAVCVLAVPGLKTGLERLSALRNLVPWMLVALMGVNAVSVVWFLFRNVYGVRTGPGRLPSAPGPIGTPSWNPPFGQGAVLGLVVLAFASGVVAVWSLGVVPPALEALQAPISEKSEDGENARV